ncbi:hypothetical protein GCM10027411_18240 [Microbacterium aureliae]
MGTLWRKRRERFQRQFARAANPLPDTPGREYCAAWRHRSRTAEGTLGPPSAEEVSIWTGVR